MPAGTVKFYNDAKGYGFIVQDGGGGDVFVHATALKEANIPTLKEKDRLTFEIEDDKRGSKAVNVRLA